MEKTEEFKRKLHFMMAFIGGYIGAYALLNRADVFGNAQTCNLIHIVMSILGGNFLEFCIRIGGMLIYMAGIVLVVIWPKITKINVHFLAVAVDAAVLLILGFLPKEMDIMLSLYPIFFAVAVQWSAFPGVYGYNCSTIFSTNNLKQFTMAATEYIFTHEKKHSHKAKFYGGVLLFYHLGVAFSYLACVECGVRASWIGILPVLIATGMVIVEERLSEKTVAVLESGSKVA